jgi:hypothetical protein
MFDQHNDGSHEITLHKIRCPGRAQFPDTSGVLKWNRTTGITYSLTFNGIWKLVGSPYYEELPQSNKGVGRLVGAELTRPTWIAETDDGSEVHLYGVIETPSSKTGTDGTSSSFEGSAMFAVVEIPTKRMLAFDNSTEENYRLFFVGGAGRRFHKDEDVTFEDSNGTHNTARCSITLAKSPRIALVSAHALVRCQPSGWLAFENAPTASDCEMPAYHEQNFISFLNGEKIPFHWADRRISETCIRRTYFGWVKCKQKDRDEVIYQPLPFMSGIEVFSYGEEVLLHLPNLFQNFVEKSELFDFGIALHPLWTAFDSVFQDRLALASVSLERTVSMWDGCRIAVLAGPPASDAVVWKNKPLLKSLRKALREQLEKVLNADCCKRRCQNRVVRGLISCVNIFVEAAPCSGLTDSQREELRAVVTARINNSTNIPNSARLRRPFEDLQIPLSAEDDKAIQERNTALHGRQGQYGIELDGLNVSAEYFDRIRMLITKFVLKLCDYKGPYIDYASRPSTGNFEVKTL